MSEVCKMNEVCREHSGMVQKLENIEEHAMEAKITAKITCKKLDNLKILIITLMGGVVVQLLISIMNGGG